MKVACVQQQARAVWEYLEAKKDIFGYIDEAGKAGTDLLLIPECAYPAYFVAIDDNEFEKAMSLQDEILAGIKERAEKYGMYIAIGLVYREGGKTYNAGLLFDDKGQLINKAYKSNHWHFDHKCFEPGRSFEIFDTKFGRMGMIVCADGRIPEIARILAIKGARVIIDLVNLVASASDPKALMNQQYAFILSVRAMENNTWLLAANKCGVEAKTVGYLGRSMVINPDGKIVADCPTDEAMILYYDLDLADTAPIKGRRPEQYSALTTPTEKLPIYKKMTSPLSSALDMELYVTTVQFAPSGLEDYIEKSAYYIKAAELADSGIISLPLLPQEADLEGIAKKLMGAIKGSAVATIACGAPDRRRGLCFTKDRILGKWSKGTEPCVCETGKAGLSMLFDDEPYIPELPRVTMLKGAEIVIWCDGETRPMDLKVMQTRSAENKMFMIRTSCLESDASCVTNPSGGVSTSVLKGSEMSAGTLLFKTDGLCKSVIPGTNIVTGRRPECYGELISL